MDLEKLYISVKVRDMVTQWNHKFDQRDSYKGMKTWWVQGGAPLDNFSCPLGDFFILSLIIQGELHEQSLIRVIPRVIIREASLK